MAGAPEAELLMAEKDHEIAPQATAARSTLSVLRYVRVVGACVLYLIIGPTLILVNRTVLKERKFHYPMALSGLGLVFSSMVSAVLVGCSCVRLEHRKVVTVTFFLRNLAPIGAAMATTLAAGNAVWPQG